MTITISTTYTLKWMVSFAENYRFTKDGICINSKRFKIGQKIVCIKPDEFGYLAKEEIYEVRGFCYGGHGVHLKGIYPTHNMDN